MTATAFATAPPVATDRGAGFLSATTAVAERTVRKFLRTPQLVVVGSIQGAMFLLIFRYVFGGAISTNGLSYVDFLVPGFVMTGVLFSGTSAAAGVAEDVEGGFLNRLRSLPVPRLSVVAGRVTADTALVVWGLVVMTLVGFVVGFRVHTDAASALLAFGLCILFGFAFTWMFATIGLYAGSAQAAQGMSLLVFPLSFVSSAYVPVHSMPGWMQAFASHQPVTVMVNAVRALTVGTTAAGLSHNTGHYVIASLIWSAVIVAVFAPIAIARYSRG
jgi:ABC transporter DrrB family efflux protein